MPPSALTSSAARILEVRDRLVSDLLDLEPEQRRQLIQFLLERCYVVFALTASIDRAHRMFMVLNATGKPLARNDILKAELLGDVPMPRARRRAPPGRGWKKASTTISKACSATSVPCTDGRSVR